jgi:hypothetical protein
MKYSSVEGYERDVSPVLDSKLRVYKYKWEIKDEYGQCVAGGWALDPWTSSELSARAAKLLAQAARDKSLEASVYQLEMDMGELGQ